VARAPIRSADQASAFLMSLVRDDPRPYQGRAALAQLPVQALLSRLGDPHAGLPAVHIAGSKGKGSTVLYLEAILEATGLHTGSFTSPHLQRWTERFRIGGEESEPQAFADLMARLQPHVEQLLEANAATAPSFFDVLTAAALLLFAERGVDYAIIEAGIGARLDATIAVQARLTCITSVELEHTDKLGTSIAAIAAEKAGIIKQGVPIIIGPLTEAAQSVVRARAAAAGAPVSALGHEIILHPQTAVGMGPAIHVSLDGRDYRAALPANTSEANRHNAALAIACAHHLAGHDQLRLQQALTRALADASLPGRMELLGEHPWVLVDGAHTPASAHALAEMLDRIAPRRVHLVVSVSAARDAGTLLSPLLARAYQVIVTRADATRSLPSDRLARAIIDSGYPAFRLQTVADPRQAVLEARHVLAPDDLLCITGSMYMAGVAREALLAHAPAQSQRP
jgi:dihydrofolate synthase/folylpolyglutamate synthase